MKSHLPPVSFSQRHGSRPSSPRGDRRPFLTSSLANSLLYTSGDEEDKSIEERIEEQSEHLRHTLSHLPERPEERDVSQENLYQICQKQLKINKRLIKQLEENNRFQFLSSSAPLSPPPHLFHSTEDSQEEMDVDDEEQKAEISPIDGQSANISKAIEILNSSETTPLLERGFLEEFLTYQREINERLKKQMDEVSHYLQSTEVSLSLQPSGEVRLNNEEEMDFLARMFFPQTP